MKNCFEFEVGLSVEDFYQGDRDEAFEIAADSPHIAVRYARAEIRDLMNIRRLPKLTFEASFSEFDSGNISHATAHYNIAVCGPANFIEKFRRIYEEEYL